MKIQKIGEFNGDAKGDTEEAAITYGEKVATEICEYLKSEGILKI